MEHFKQKRKENNHGRTEIKEGKQSGCFDFCHSYTINTLYVDYDAVAESGRNPNPNPILYSLCGL